PLQRHDAIGLGPAAVVAEAHADDAIEGAEYREAEIAGIEIAPLELLHGARHRVGSAREMDLAVLADDRPRLVDKDARIVPAAFLGLLGIAQEEADAEPPGRLEE